MSAKRLLYCTAQHLAVYRSHSGALIEEGVFAANAEGRRAFAALLQAGRGGTFWLLANVADEGFHVETIPYLRGADRRTVIERKLAQQFFNAPLAGARSLGYEKERRRNERVLLAALTHHETFAPWLAALEEAGAALAGLYSLPFLAPALLKKMSLADEASLLLGIQDSSLRQSYFEKGELIFSRLTPLTNSSVGGMAQALASEALKLQQYLISQRLIGRQQGVLAYILTHPDAARIVQASCIDTPGVRYRLLDTSDCARRIGLKNAPEDMRSEPLFLHLLTLAPPSIQFADEAQRHAYRLGRLRAGLYALAAALFLAALPFSGKFLFDTYRLNREADRLRVEAAQFKQRYADIVATFPSVPTDHETLRRVVGRHAELEGQSGRPDGLYRELSRALDAVPGIDIDRLDWKIGGEAAAGGEAVSFNAPAGGEALLVRGTLRLGPNANARQFVAAFERFLDELRLKHTLKIDVLKRPVDVESGKSLKSVDGAPEEAGPRAFAVQISRVQP